AAPGRRLLLFAEEALDQSVEPLHGHNSVFGKKPRVSFRGGPRFVVDWGAGVGRPLCRLFLAVCPHLGASRWSVTAVALFFRPRPGGRRAWPSPGPLTWWTPSALCTCWSRRSRTRWRCCKRASPSRAALPGSCSSATG